MTDSKLESQLVKKSLYVTLLFALFSFILGLIFQSQVIIFDGLYSLIGVGITFFSLYAVKFTSEEDWQSFPFGKDIVEPLVIVINYSIILLLVLASLINAVITIIQGGREILLGPSLIYTAISTGACLIMFLYLKKHGSKINSSFINVEANQWYMDTLVSGGILVGFIVALVFDNISELQPFVSYIDPIMLIVISGYFMKVPLTEIKSSMREILSMPPDKEIRQQVNQAVKVVVDQYQFKDYYLRVTKVGKTLKLELDFVVKEKDREMTVFEQDQIREEISEQLEIIEYQKWLTISFTRDYKWAV